MSDQTRTPPSVLPVLLERHEFDALFAWLGKQPSVAPGLVGVYYAMRATLSAHPDDVPSVTPREARGRERDAYHDGWQRGIKGRDGALDRDYPSLPPAPRPWGPEIVLSAGTVVRTNGKTWEVRDGHQWCDRKHMWPMMRTPDVKLCERAWLAAGGTFEEGER